MLKSKDSSLVVPEHFAHNCIAGWKESFSVVIGGDEVTAGKPSPEM